MKSMPIIISLIIAIIVLVFAVSGVINFTKSTGSSVARGPAAVPSKLSQARMTIVPPYHDCYDTDGGKNFYEKGTVIVDGMYWTDKCDVYGRLIENICMYAVQNQPQRGFVIYDCPTGCKEGRCNIVP